MIQIFANSVIEVFPFEQSASSNEFKYNVIFFLFQMNVSSGSITFSANHEMFGACLNALLWFGI